MALPFGTITFLFTDIEGSTRQWEQHPDEMARALARHDDLLREAIEKNGGHVFKTVGDAFCAAFATATDALQATLDIQLSLAREAWPELVAMKVRMALHTGAAEQRNDDYFGQPLNRVARLLSAGHGGQVLLSLATAELVRDSMTGDLKLQDLGERRLKDLIRPERIFQIVSPDLDQDFPPLKTLDSVGNNLPIQLSSFVGREQEMAEVEALVKTSRIVTLVGSGGSGKTRLSIQTAANLLDDFDGGVWLVELAPLVEPSNIVPAIAQAVNVREEPGRDLLSTLIDNLAKRNILLILDNCEHVIEECARLASQLCISCASLKILATSREPLGIAGEQTYRVPSLRLPPAFQATAESLSQYEAVQLFIDRALLGNPAFSVTNENAPALAELCVRLDGIPLALELAAARIHTLSVQEINDRLHDRFRLLSAGSRTAVPRQKTLRALVDWSYDLLAEAEKKLLCRLSIFANGWTLAAAERVCADKEEDVFDLLHSLIDKSLVGSEPTDLGTRYRLLQTVRQYGADRLSDFGDEAEIRRRHRDYFANIAIDAGQDIKGPNQTMLLQRLEADHDNIRGSLQSFLDEEQSQERGLQTASALFYFWWIRGHWAEARTWYHRFLQTTPDSEAAADAYTAAGSLALYQGQYDRAHELYERSLQVRQGLPSQAHIATSLHNLAHVAHLQGDLETAKPLYEQSIAMKRKLNDDRAMTESLNNLANLMQDLGEYDEARRMHEESLALRRPEGAAQSVGQSLHNLGCLALVMGNFAEATTYFREALPFFMEIRDVRGVSQILHSFADIAIEMSRPADAAILWGAAEAIRESIGAPIYELDREQRDVNLARAQEQLGIEAFDKAWNTGYELSLDEAAAMAIGT